MTNSVAALSGLTPGADIFTAPIGSSTFNGLGGVDTIIFDFELTDAAFSWIGNQLVVDTATSHTILSGFEVFQFADGTVHNDDANPLVDDLYYYVNSPELWSAHVDADAHYDLIGWHEKRNPNAFFNTKLYLSIYHDVAASGLSPTQHHDQFGWQQNRLFSLDFDAQQYLLSNPDVAAAQVDPLTHFLAFGAGEGRQPAAPLTYPALNGFDYVHYLQHNPDVLAAGVDPLQHFQTFGWKEGRNPNAFFDTAGYLATYTDVAAAGVDPLDHFHQFGWAEGRMSSPSFDPQQYLAHYADVAAAQVDPLLHYLIFGIHEGRSTFAAPIIDTDGAVNTVVEGAANGIHVGVTVAWGGWKSPSLFYTLSGDTSGGGFAIDAATGVITVLDGSKIDFESSLAHSYTVTVTAHDAGQTSSQTFIVAVADAAPALPTSQKPIGVVDELAATGSTVGITFTVTDPNGPAATYELTDDANGRFTIDPNTGVVTVASGAAIDYETAPGHAYSITAKATVGGSSTSETFTINVNNINEVPTGVALANVVTAIDENTVVGSGIKVADVTVTDDALGSAALSLSGADKALFELRGGSLYFIGASPDFETKPSYAVMVEADDPAIGGAVDAQASFTLTVTDVNEAPTAVSFANTATAIDENTVVGTGIKIADIVVTDDALGNEALTLSGADKDSFELRGSELYFIGTGPDFEAKASYAVTVEAVDPTIPGSTVSASFTLTVTDVNEAPSAVSFANTVAAIDENMLVGSGIKVADIVVTDDALGSVTLTLSGADKDSFELRGMELYFIGASPDFEAKPSYAVTVEAVDPIIGSTAVTANYTLTVTDVNEAPTAVSFANTVTAIDENTVVGTGIKVADIVVTDDALGSEALTLSGADKDSFELRGSELYFIGTSPDFETKASYAVTVEAVDSIIGSTAVTANFTLTVTDVNEAPTAVSFANTVTAIDENTVVGTGIKVADIVVTDDALGSEALTLSGADKDSFELRGTELYFIGASPDFEAKPSYAVTVEAVDPIIGSTAVTANYTLTVTDVNEAPTAVSFANTVTAIDENTVVGTGIKVADVVVTDDALGSETLTLSGADRNFFELRGTELYFIGTDPDFEAKSSYAVTVEAVDTTVAGSTASASFTLTVNDLVENVAPQITSSTNGTVQRDVSFQIPANAITNGSFEQGLNTFPPDLPGWSFGGNRAAFLLGSDPNSGSTSLYFLSGTTVTQSVWTVAGVSYTLDFWLRNWDIQSRPNDFTVSWNGTVVDTYTDVPGAFDAPWIKHSYELVGLGGPVALTFAGANPNGWTLDDVSLTPLTIVTPGTETTSGTVTFTDVDTTDTHTVSYAAQGSNYLGTFTPTLSPANDTTGGQTGTVNWTFSVADAALSSLAAQQSITQTYTVTIDDGRGGHDSRDVTVTLTNPDHAPVVTASTDGSVARDDLDDVASGNLIGNPGFENGLGPWIYVTGGQLTNGSAHSGGWAYTGNGTQTVGQSFATVPGLTYSVGFWLTYGSGNSPHTATVLWDGATVVSLTDVPATDDGFGNLTYAHYTYQVVATAGTSSLTFAFDNGSSNFWLDDVSVSTVPDAEATYGTISFTDVDTIDIHTVSYQANGANYVGTFTPTLAPANDATGGHPGTVNWTFSVADSALTFLAAQQSVVQTYTVTIADNHGGATTREVAVTLTNPDHAPVITSGPQSGGVLEDYSFTVPIGNVVQNGGFEIAFQDQQGQSSIIPGWVGAGFLYLPQGSSQPHSGHGTVAFATSAGQTGTWSQSVPTVAGVHYTLDFWAAAAFSSNNSIAVSWNGQTVFARSNVPALPGHNPTGPGDYTRYTVDVVGQAGFSNLVFSLSTAYYWFLDDVSVTAVGITPGTETTHGTLSFTDADTTDTHTVSVAPNGNIGTLTASIGTDSTGGQTGTVNWSYAVADSAFDFLKAQATLDQTFTVIVADDHGGTTAGTVTITLTGVNDAPTVANPIADQRAGPNAPFLFQLPANTFHDVDTGDTLTLSATLADGSALPAWLQFDAATGTFSGQASATDPSISVKVTATDGSGTAVSDTFVIAANQAPALVLPGEALTKSQLADISSIANAMVLDGHLGLGANANIALATVIPHVSVSATGGGKLDLYKFTVTAGARGIFDIDGGLDTLINLLDSNGNLIAWNDDSRITDGAGGSAVNEPPNTTYDSFLDFTFTTGGTYYLAVGVYNGGSSTPLPVPSGATYQLQVSLSSAGIGPVLDPFTPGAGTPSGAVGTLVASLVDLPGNGGHDNVIDPDAAGLTGIALSGTDASQGSWWYSLDNGASWNPVGSVDEQHALLLAADAGTRLYFQPAAGFAGKVGNAITFHAWDRTSGSAGQIADASVNGGITAFSSATVTLAIGRVDLPPTDIVWNGVTPTSGTALPSSNTTIANLSAVDPDDTSGFTYALAGSSSNFAVTADGAVSKASSFSSSTNYTLDIQVSDSFGATFVERFTIFTGSTGADTLTGTSGDDVFYGRQGDDTIRGGAGNDTLFAQDGNDTLTGAAGNDVIDGGAGIDTLDFSDATAGITFTLTQSASDTVVDLTAAGLGVDTYRNMEGAIGTDLVDTINGSTGNDVITGGLGDDILNGDDGNDTFKYALGDGADAIDGGQGSDTLTIVGTTGSDTFTAVVSGGVLTSGLGGATLISIESFALDLLAGSDTLSYAGTTEAVAANLATATATGFSAIAGVDNLTGGDGNDTLAGNGSANVVNGGAGDDTINYVAGGGADTVDGGTNTATGDTLAVTGTTGNDSLTVVVSGGVITAVAGGSVTDVENFTLDLLGNTASGDTLSYAGTGSGQSIVANLSTGSATGFSTAIAGVENLTGGDGDDTLTGDGNANTLSGGLGADSLSGGGGNDILVGDQGDTLLDGGANSDTLQLGASFTSNDDGQILNVENVILTAAATLNLSSQTEGFAITGSTGTDIITGGGAADVITGGKAGDTLTGGAGIDRFVFNSADSTLSITGSGNNGVVSGFDTITDFDIVNEKIDFAVAPIAPGATSNFNDSSLTIGGLSVQTHAIANGVVTFRNGSSNLSLASMSDVAAAVQYLRGGDLGSAGATVAFTATLSGVAHTFLYQQVGNSQSGNNDLLVDLNNVTITNLTSLFGSGNRIDPIILDLAHDGFSLSSFADGVQFDMDGDGIRDRMAWTSGEDGILAFDVDGSGTIDNGSELFSPCFAGGNFADGLAALATLDSNHDRRIDAADADFGRLLVWQDLNHDGVSDAGELRTLTELDIAAISLDATPLDGYIDGQTVLAQGTFSHASGGTGDFIEVAFDWRSGRVDLHHQADFLV